MCDYYNKAEELVINTKGEVRQKLLKKLNSAFLIIDLLASDVMNALIIYQTEEKPTSRLLLRQGKRDNKRRVGIFQREVLIG